MMRIILNHHKYCKISLINGLFLCTLLWRKLIKPSTNHQKNRKQTQQSFQVIILPLIFYPCSELHTYSGFRPTQKLFHTRSENWSVVLSFTSQFWLFLGRSRKLPVVIVSEQDNVLENQNFSKASTSERLTSTEVKEKADHLLSAVFKHKKYKTTIQKQAIYAIARSEYFFLLIHKRYFRSLCWRMVCLLENDRVLKCY